MENPKLIEYRRAVRERNECCGMPNYSTEFVNDDTFIYDCLLNDVTIIAAMEDGRLSFGWLIGPMAEQETSDVLHQVADENISKFLRRNKTLVEDPAYFQLLPIYIEMVVDAEYRIWKQSLQKGGKL